MGVAGIEAAKRGRGAHADRGVSLAVRIPVAGHGVADMPLEGKSAGDAGLRTCTGTLSTQCGECVRGVSRATQGHAEREHEGVVMTGHGPVCPGGMQVS